MILAIDVGKGTEDVICWDGKSSVENAIQLVMPSTAQLFKNQIAKLLEDNKPIFITGDTIAGEPWHKVVYEYCSSNPGSVVMDKTAARSLRYNLDQVKSRGIKVVDNLDNPPQNRTIRLQDIYWERLIELLEKSDVNSTDIEAVLICCQDHGEPENPLRSARDFRMKEIYYGLNHDGRLHSLLMSNSEVPPQLPRLQSIVGSASVHFPDSKIFVMDSSPAVVLGAMAGEGEEIVVNIGNGHTVVMFISNGIVQLVYEHHSGLINKEKLKNHIEGLLSGALTHSDVLNDKGHGVYRRTTLNPSIEYTVKVIGPNRGKVSGLGDYVHPGGSMMMAGPLGLLRAYSSREASLVQGVP